MNLFRRNTRQDRIDAILERHAEEAHARYLADLDAVEDARHELGYLAGRIHVDGDIAREEGREVLARIRRIADSLLAEEKQEAEDLIDAFAPTFRERVRVAPLVEAMAEQMGCVSEGGA